MGERIIPCNCPVLAFGFYEKMWLISEQTPDQEEGRGSTVGSHFVKDTPGKPPALWDGDGQSRPRTFGNLSVQAAQPPRRGLTVSTAHSTISAWTRPGLRGPRDPPARRGLTEPTPSPHAHRWALCQDLRRPGDGKLPKRWAQVTPAETEAPARDGGAPRRPGSTLLPAGRHWAAALGGGGAGPAPAGGHPAGEVEPAAPGPALGPPDLGPPVASGQLETDSTLKIPGYSKRKDGK
ncbi:uncharacterized protein [Sagmatias obliquidens]|uniref:uncharacterized protein n=1 Tax=Sagmatias obliquidens TaxID=3371155 RepID=UPI000F444A03|nr:uncharacterized protein LOC113626712 [Lagenorhynchus obliquidens]